MSCPAPKCWRLLSMNVLTPDEAEDLRSHAATCETCRQRLRDANAEDAALRRAYATLDRGHDRQRDQFVAALARQRSTRSAQRTRRIGDVWSMIRTKPTQTAAVALLPAACVVTAVLLFTMGPQSVALADVIKRVQESQSLTCHIDIKSEFTVNAPPSTRSSVSARLTAVSRPDGCRWRVDFDDSSESLLKLSNARYARLHGEHGCELLDELPIDHNAKRETLFKNPIASNALADAAGFFERLKTLSAEPDDVLSRKDLGDREVVGFEVAGWKLGLGMSPEELAETSRFLGVDIDENATVRIWADVATRLPVRIEAEFEQIAHMGADGTADLQTRQTIVLDDMRWNETIDMTRLTPPTDEISGDDIDESEMRVLTGFLDAYSQWSSEALKQLNALRDAHAVDGDETEARVLEFQLDQSGLRRAPVFPAELSAECVKDCTGNYYAYGMALLIKKEELTQFILSENAEKANSLKKQAAEVERIHRALLAANRKPEYFGKTAAPGDGEAVLMRWRADGGKMRVIYGDLRIATE